VFNLPLATHSYVGKADKSLDWLDAWKQMEKIYETQRDKVKAIGTHTLALHIQLGFALILPQGFPTFLSNFCSGS
jgi:hypothetical protein